MIKHEIPFIVLPEVEGIVPVFLKLKLGPPTTTVGCWYRRHISGEDSRQSLYNYFEENVQNTRFLLLGDCNLPDIDWLSMNIHSACSEVFIDTMLRFELHRVFDEPKRVRGVTSSVLDLIFLRDHFPADKTKLELMDDICHHKLALCPVPFHDKIYESNIKITYPDFNLAGDASILNHIIMKFPYFVQL